MVVASCSLELLLLYNMTRKKCVDLLSLHINPLHVFLSPIPGSIETICFALTVVQKYVNHRVLESSRGSVSTQSYSSTYTMSGDSFQTLGSIYPFVTWSTAVIANRIPLQGGFLQEGKRMWQRPPKGHCLTHQPVSYSFSAFLRLWTFLRTSFDVITNKHSVWEA